jgi:hypothetical protein
MRSLMAVVVWVLLATSALAADFPSDRQNFTALKGLEAVVQPLSDEELSQIEGQSVSQTTCPTGLCIILLPNGIGFLLTEGTTAKIVNTPYGQDRLILRVPGVPTQVFRVSAF